MLPLCTVRTCHQPLVREERRLVCPRGHSFDVARSGYVNLLQPNERRSKSPGDSAEVVAARARLRSAAACRRFDAALLHDLKAAASRRTPKAILDVGCGDGYWLSQLNAKEKHGIDISVPAIEVAARKYPDSHWFVANADRFVPYADASFDLVLSITSRINMPEFRRVLKDDGQLLIAVAADDDLRELRGGDPGSKPAPHESAEFTLMDQRRITERVYLDRDAIRDVMLSSYRSMREVDVDGCDVTFSRDLLLFAPTRRGSRRDSPA